MTEEKRPKVGLGVIVVKEEKVLLLQRKNSHGQGSWSPAGGHLEYGETFKKCALRELEEEAGLKPENIKLTPLPVAVTNDYFRVDDKHYITVFMKADYLNGKPRNCEPDRCERLGWFEWDNLPAPLFLPFENLIKQGYNPFK